MERNVFEKRAFLNYLWALAIVVIAFTAGFFFRGWWTPQSNFPVLLQAYELFRDNALNELPSPQVLEHDMIRGMLQAANDPFTILVEPSSASLQNDQLEGKFGGIGAKLEKDTQGNVMLYPVPDSPASANGVQEGDRLLAIGDMKITTETPVDQILTHLRGPVGTPVTITFGHPPHFVPITATIERAEIALPSVTWHQAPNEARVGILEVNLIAATTPDEIIKGIEEMKSKGASSFILDLRNNGGGLVEAGVDTARLFLKEGIVIQQQFRGKPVRSFEVNGAGRYADVPLAVLINGASASASEIIAGALQAQKRARLLGSPSFGKNTIQLLFELDDKSSLHITAAHWWVPGLDLPADSPKLQPDVLIPDDPNNSDAPLQAAIKMLVTNQ